jgi:uncharacterized peroxidase-related enzyme
VVQEFDGEELDAWLQAVATNWHDAALSDADAALCEFAERLTRTPGGMTSDDVGALRGAGFGDEGIHEAIQVIAYFNYINRVADAAHVDLEPEMAGYPDSGAG